MSTIISNQQLEQLPKEEYNTITDIKIKNFNNDLLPIIFQLINLKTLHIFKHNIIKLDGIGNLTNLQDLRIRCGELNEIPQDIQHLTKLQILILSENHLTTLPIEIKFLKKLKQLDLSENRLQYLPDEISELESITHLNLYSNVIEYFPETIAKLQNIVNINLMRSCNKTFNMQKYISCDNKMMIFDYDAKINIESITHLIIFNLNIQLEYLPNSLEYLKIYNVTEHIVNLPPALNELVLFYPTSKMITQQVPYGCKLIFSSPTNNTIVDNEF